MVNTGESIVFDNSSRLSKVMLISWSIDLYTLKEDWSRVFKTTLDEPIVSFARIFSLINLAYENLPLEIPLSFSWDLLFMLEIFSGVW